jgi:signal transduction histidine kinase
MTTVVRILKGAPAQESVKAFREAGIGVVDVEGWEAASEILRDCGAALVVCDGEVLAGIDAVTLKQAVVALGAAKSTALPADVARSLSHDLRTPLSAMVGWLHLMDSGKLDESGMKRAIQKLRSNIDDQVRMIDQYLGTNSTRNGSA